MSLSNMTFTDDVTLSDENGVEFDKIKIKWSQREKVGLRIIVEPKS